MKFTRLLPPGLTRGENENVLKNQNKKKGSEIMKMNTKIKNIMGEDDPLLTAPMIDKLSAVANFSNDGLNNIAFEVVIDWIEDHEPGIVKVPVSGKYQLAVKMHYPDKDGLFHQGGPFLLLQLTHPKVGKQQARIEYNPVHLTPAGEDWLEEQFNQLLDMGFYEFLHHCRFTRVDWCRNIMFRSIEDYLICGKWKKVSQCYFSPEGSLQTINLGKSGNDQIVVYDKAAEKHGAAATHSTIRVEARCRINMTATELAGMKNPFKNVILYHIGCKNPPFGQGHWRAFQDACRLRGVRNAIKMQPVKDRPAIKKVLSTLPVSWWDISDDDWSWLQGEAYENAGLTNIPGLAPPLLLNYQQAA